MNSKAYMFGRDYQDGQLFVRAGTPIESIHRLSNAWVFSFLTEGGEVFTRSSEDPRLFAEDIPFNRGILSAVEAFSRERERMHYLMERQRNEMVTLQTQDEKEHYLRENFPTRAR